MSLERDTADIGALPRQKLWVRGVDGWAQRDPPWPWALSLNTPENQRPGEVDKGHPIVTKEDGSAPPQFVISIIHIRLALSPNCLATSFSGLSTRKGAGPGGGGKERSEKERGAGVQWCRGGRGSETDDLCAGRTACPGTGNLGRPAHDEVFGNDWYLQSVLGEYPKVISMYRNNLLQTGE